MMILLFKAAIVLSILLGFYKLFLQEESFFGINRTYLIIGLLLTFLLPFISLPELVNHQGIVETMVFETKMTKEKVPSKDVGTELSTKVVNYEINESADKIITVSTKGNKGVSFWIGLFYFFGVTILSINFFTQLWGLFLKINRSEDRIVEGRSTILNQTDDTEPCSFFNYIFISPSRYGREHICANS